MVMDPNDLGQGPGGGGDPATGSPSPADLEALRKRNEELEADNRKLRVERRVGRVTALVDEHNLTARQAIELARLENLDEIEAKALEFVKANAGQQPPAGTPQAPPAPNQQPPVDTTGLAGMQGGEDGGTPTAPPKTPEERLREEINGAKSLEEIQQIQNRYRQEQKAAYR
jgi:hypothetical protein